MLKHLSNADLKNILSVKVKQERALSVEIIELLEEMERRKLYLSLGYGSLLDYCVKDLGYSETAAYRRIQAMRISQQVPEVKTALSEGRLNLANVAKVQSMFKAEAKINNPYSVQEKRELLKALEHKTQRETEKILANESDLVFQKEQLRAARDGQAQLTIVVTEKLLAKLHKIRALTSHKNPNATYADLIDMMADIVLAKIDPSNEPKQKVLIKNSFSKPAYAKKIIANVAPADLPSAKENSAKDKSAANTLPTDQRKTAPPVVSQRIQKSARTSIPAATRRLVWQNENGRCGHKDSRSGRICHSTFQLQIDHRIPVAKGGTNDLANLRLVCRAHNLMYAREHFGERIMT